MDVADEPRGRGCLFWGCLTTAIVFLLLLIGAPLALYFTARHYVNLFSSNEPAKIAVVELPEERLEEVASRFEAFAKAIKAGDAPDDFEITAEELNGLISQNEDWAGKVFLRIEDGRVGGDVSFPIDAWLAGKERYFNASVDFEVALRDGELTIVLEDAEVNGKPLPSGLLVALADENLGEQVEDDPGMAEVLSKFESLEVIGDKIVLRPRRDAPAAKVDGLKGDGVKGEIDSFDEADPPTEVPAEE